MLRPLGDRVLVKPIYPEPLTSESGIEVVELHDEPVTMGTVMTLPKATCSNPKCRCGRPSPFEPGQTVIFPPTAGEETQIDGEPYIMLREQDILAIVEE